MRRVRDESFSLEAPGVYILNVSVEGVLSSTFPVKWESVSVQSCDCRTVVGVSHVVRSVPTWPRMRSITSS